MSDTEFPVPTLTDEERRTILAPIASDELFAELHERTRRDAKIADVVGVFGYTRSSLLDMRDQYENDQWITPQVMKMARGAFEEAMYGDSYSCAQALWEAVSDSLPSEDEVDGTAPPGPPPVPVWNPEGKCWEI